MSRDSRLYLDDILEAAGRVRSYLEGATRQTLDTDPRSWRHMSYLTFHATCPIFFERKTAEKPIAWLHGEIKTPPFSNEGRVRAGFLLREL